MAAKSRKSSSKKQAHPKPVSYLTNRPYLTIAVLAALVCALAYTVEVIHNSQLQEAQSNYEIQMAQLTPVPSPVPSKTK